MSVAIKKILYAADAKESALAQAEGYLSQFTIAEAEAEAEAEAVAGAGAENGAWVFCFLFSNWKGGGSLACKVKHFAESSG